MKLEKQINWFKKHWFKPKEQTQLESQKEEWKTKIDKVKAKRALREKPCKNY